MGDINKRGGFVDMLAECHQFIGELVFPYKTPNAYRRCSILGYRQFLQFALGRRATILMSACIVADFSTCICRLILSPIYRYAEQWR